jgi:hypothetical protein
MKRSRPELDCTINTSLAATKPIVSSAAESENATALLNYFDSMAMASEADHVELSLRYVVNIERLALFRSLAGLIVDAYFSQRSVRLRSKRLCYKQRHQEATLLSYKERIIRTLTTGRETDGAETESDSGSSSTTTPTPSVCLSDDTEREEPFDMHDWKPEAIGTRMLGNDEQVWRLCDSADRRCIGQLRLFAAWWFTNFAVVLLAIRYRKELVAYGLSIENRVRSVCNFNTLVPWCMNLAAELAVEDAALEAPNCHEARAAAIYANCKYMSDGVVSSQATRLVGFVCINSMHSADACLPPHTTPPALLYPNCGVFRHPVHSHLVHYNLERAVRLGNLAMCFFIHEQRPTMTELSTNGTTIVHAALDWLSEQQRRRQTDTHNARDAQDGRTVKGFLNRLVETLKTGVDPARPDICD